MLLLLIPFLCLIVFFYLYHPGAVRGFEIYEVDNIIVNVNTLMTEA